MSESFTGVKRDYHYNGQLRSEVFMCNGKKEGENKRFYKNDE